MAATAAWTAVATMEDERKRLEKLEQLGLRCDQVIMQVMDQKTQQEKEDVASEFNVQANKE